jgi:hypothetical protein
MHHTPACERIFDRRFLINLMKRKAGIVSGILILVLAQVFLIIRTDWRTGVPAQACVLVQAKDLPDSPWLENPDDHGPALIKNNSLTFNFRVQISQSPVKDPRFRFARTANPDPMYADRPPPPASA